MRVTLDTNVLVSATFWRGASHKIIELIEQKKLELVLSEEIIEEYRAVLEYGEIREKIQNKNLDLQWSIQKIVSLALIVIPRIKFYIVKADPDDNKVLECALAGNADYIISQDNHLLTLEEFRDIKIITPEIFLKTIKLC